MLLEPQLHHWRLSGALLIKGLPPGWPLQLINANVVFTYWLVLPLGTAGIDLGPEWKLNLKHEVVLLFLAICTDVDIILSHPYGLVGDGGAPTHIVSVSVFNFYLDLM